MPRLPKIGAEYAYVILFRITRYSSRKRVVDPRPARIYLFLRTSTVITPNRLAVRVDQKPFR